MKTARYNPLADIDETTDEGLRQIAEIRKACVIPEDDTATGPHFADNAGTILEGVITWVCHTFPPETRNMVSVYRVINSKDPVTGVYDQAVWIDALVGMSECKVGVCVQAAKLMYDAGDREGGSFLTTLSRSVKWIALQGMQHFLSGNDFSMKELATQGKKKPTIYVAVGMGNEQDFSRFIRLMTAMAIYHLRAEFRRTGKKPYPSCLIGLDEFAIFAKGLDCISTGFGTLREIGCLLWVQVQKISQLRATIGESAKLLLQNSSVQVFAVANDEEDTAAWVSNQLGYHKVKKKKGIGIWAEKISEERVPLMTRREVQDALRQHSSNQFVFPADGGRPMWLNRRGYKSFKIDGKRVFKPLDLGDIFD